jgi:hypothetical protein
MTISHSSDSASTYQNHGLGGSGCAMGLLATRKLKRHLDMILEVEIWLNGL